MSYGGADLLDADQRIERLVALWQKPIPGEWKRELDERLLDPWRRYCRKTGSGVGDAELALEHDVLRTDAGAPRWGAMSIVDGVNALPLVKAREDARRVEADMLLLARRGGEYMMIVVEVKVRSDNAWCAAVENLRQLKLFLANQKQQTLFHERQPALQLPQAIGITAGVLAPATFYDALGQKTNSVPAAAKLAQRMKHEHGVRLDFAIWDGKERAAKLLTH